MSLFAAPLPSSPSGGLALRRVLVANRGEIAVRIIKTCALLGVETVAIYSDLDADAPHVALATQAVYIGSSIPDTTAGSDFTSPYLKGDELVKLAKATDSDAIHPGYGYLSENAEFADKVVAAGLVFIGPQAESIRTIGDKAASKAFLAKFAGDSVPLVPGYSGADQDLATLVSAGKQIQYPILIKASAGGGGKGMRIVREEAALAGELERAASESKRNFGDPRLLLEKYIDNGKHIEIQIFGDKHGHVYSFFERECSVQRRHQKIIERERMSASARKIGELRKYEGAGTVEFIFDCETGAWFFLEVNTRLQVEHPITELTTGIDLVALQLFVAAGGDLSSLKEVTGVQQIGHSIEARLCAEDAFADFAPRIGTVRLWVDGLNNAAGARRDSGVETGSEVTVFFDPMLAKLIVHAADRPTAIRKLESLLRSHVCIGLTTNQPFLLNCLSHPSFLSGQYTTALIPNHIDALLAPTSNALDANYTTRLAVAASTFLRQVRSHVRSHGSDGGALASIPDSWANNREDLTRRPLEHLAVVLPDGTTSGFRLELEIPKPGDSSRTPFQSYETTEAYRTWADIEQVAPGKTGQSAKDALIKNYYGGSRGRDGKEGRKEGDWSVGIDDADVRVGDVKVAGLRLAQSCSGPKTWFHGYLRISIDGIDETFFLATDDFAGTTAASQTVWIHSRKLGGAVQIHRRDLLTFAGELDKRVASGDLGEGAKYLSSMPCRILEILAEDGSNVKVGDGLLIMESMKTEIRLSAKADGVVKLHVAEGDICSEGMVLCEIVETED
ncbi:hypothetical protein RQP46_010813 [Phenoliferia psychrophenolica]